MNPDLRERFEEHRKVRQEELFELADLLESNGLTQDPGPLQLAAAGCKGKLRTAPPGMPDAGRQYWGYQIDRLHLRLEEQRHCRPRRASADRLTAVLSVTVQEYVPTIADEQSDSYGLLRNVTADFQCDALIDIDSEVHELRSAWHIDTHLYLGTQSAGVHPRFHFQVGGEGMEDFDDRIRGVFLPEAPRMACAPVDGILAVDFVLSHYCGAMWEDLRLMEARYGRLRAPAMNRYWGPYYRLIAGALDGVEPVAINSDPGYLLPNLAIG